MRFNRFSSFLVCAALFMWLHVAVNGYAQGTKGGSNAVKNTVTGSAPAAEALTKWVPFTGVIPENAVVGGYENGQPMYVGRVAFEGGMHPGKVIAGGYCNIGWGGKEYSFDKDFEILTAPANAVTWVAYKGTTPANAILGGYNDAAKKEPLYIAKHAYKDGEHCGKLWANACNIGWGGAEVVLKNSIFVLAAKEEVKKPTGPYVRTENSHYLIGQIIPVEYGNFPGSPSVWITVVPKGKKDTERGEYVYAIEKDGVVEINSVTLGEGEYELRAYFGAFDTAAKARATIIMQGGGQ